MTKYSIVVEFDCAADSSSLVGEILEKLWIIDRAQWYSIKHIEIKREGEASFGKMNAETMQWSGKE